MALFGRQKRGEHKKQPRTSGEQQPPDELADRARLAYGHQEFGQSLELYAASIDKLHTMYVIGQGKYRQPSEADDGILTGFVNAVGAARAADQHLDRSAAESAVNYLGEIREIVGCLGGDPDSYDRAIRDAMLELR